MYLVTSHADHKMSGVSVFLFPFLPMDTTVFRNEPRMINQHSRSLVLVLPPVHTLTLDICLLFLT